MAITKRQADALTYDPNGPAQQVLWDGDLPGFGLRVFPSGVKSWVVLYRNRSGRSRLMTLGRYGVLTVDGARRRAKAIQAEALEGRDPLEERKAARQGETVRALADEWIERHAKHHNRSWREQKRLLDKHVLPVLGSRKVRDLTRADVARLHAKIGERTPILANRVHEVLRAMLERGRAWGYLPENAPNPAEGIERFPENRRERWVTGTELPRLLAAIDAEPDPYVRALFRLYLLTGARRRELLNAKWDDVDLKAGVLYVQRPKGRGKPKPRAVPLSSAALDVLREIPRLAGNAYIFPSPTRKGRPLVNPDKPWRRVRERAGLSDVRIHDLRRTTGAMLASSGVSLPIIAETLGHSSTRATEIYARIASEAARAALERHAAAVAAVTGGERES